MGSVYPQIRELLHQRADYQARLNLIPFDGSPEIKDRDGKKYLCVRKRVASRLTSTYVGEYPLKMESVRRQEVSYDKIRNL
jgi:hypothetical protein